MSDKLIITACQLTQAFEEVGLKQGDSLIVHSSLSSLGRVEGGADAVLDALLNVIGPEGNLMLPTFNYTRPLPDPWFDPSSTPARTGIIPETGRKRPEFIRSLHPTHSVAVAGPNADEMTKDHLTVRAFGIGSPIDRLAKRGGKVLLLGVDHTANSLIHVAEEYAGIPKASWYDPLPVVQIRLSNGNLLEHLLDTSPSCSAAFGGTEFLLRRHGEIRDLRIGGSKVQLMEGEAVLRRVCEALAEKPDALLCTWSDCKPCIGARKELRHQGKI